MAGRALADLARNIRLAIRSVPAQGTVLDERAATLQERMADSLARFPGHTLLVLSGTDYTAKEFVETVQSSSRWRDALKLPRVTRLDVADADHTFTEAPARRKVEEGTSRWLSQWARGD